jgi:hypothetical protein
VGAHIDDLHSPEQLLTQPQFSKSSLTARMVLTEPLFTFNPHPWRLTPPKSKSLSVKMAEREGLVRLRRIATRSPAVPHLRFAPSKHLIPHSGFAG